MSERRFSALTQPGPLRAGAASADITSPTAPAVRDPLLVKALVLDNGAARLAILSMDTTAIGGRAVSDRILDDVGEEFLPRLRQRVEKELGIPGAAVMVNASHMHPPGRLLCDDDAQVERAFDAVARASQSLAPARIGAGSAVEDRITINRTLRLKNGKHWTIRHSNPCPPDEEVAGLGPLDPEVVVLRVDRLDGSPLAVVFNFACHLLFGDVRGSLTANFPGVAGRAIEERLGRGCMALFLQGAGGDVCDVSFKDFSRPRDVTPLGAMLAQSALRAWENIQTSEIAGLGVVSEVVPLPRRTDIPRRLEALRREQAALLESLRSTCLNFKSFLPLYLRNALDPHAPADYAYRYLREAQTGRHDLADMDAWTRRHVDKYLQNIRAMERLTVIQDDMATLRKHQAINDASGSATIDAELQAMRIGPAAILAAPIELLTQIGLNVKAASPFRPTLVAGFSNGYMHYGAPAEDYDKGGYEVTECLLGPEWQALFERKAGELLGRLRGEG